MELKVVVQQKIIVWMHMLRMELIKNTYGFQIVYVLNLVIHQRQDISHIIIKQLVLLKDHHAIMQ